MTPQTRRANAADVYDGFTTADPSAYQAAQAFLDGVDRLPAIRAYKRQIRQLLALRAGDMLLDLGCGLGTEARRIATEYPDVKILGLDRPLMLAEAARRQLADAVNPVQWLSGDLESIPAPTGSVDAVMTERVLKYLPDPLAGLQEMVRVLRPGGRLACFELDQAATVYTGDPDVTAEVNQWLCTRLGEPRMGRLLPGLLKQLGMTDITFTPVAFHLPANLNETIVYQPVERAAQTGVLSDRVRPWLAEHRAAGQQDFTIGWLGWLVGACSPTAS